MANRRANGEGSVFKDGKGWKARLLVVRDPSSGNPKYVTRRARTKTVAVEALKQLQAENLRGLGPTGKDHSLGSFIELWLETHIKPNRAPKTYASYAGLLRGYVIPTLGRKRMSQVNQDDLRQLFFELSKQPLRKRGQKSIRTGSDTLSRSTLAVIKRTLHSAFSDVTARS